MLRGVLAVLALAGTLLGAAACGTEKQAGEIVRFAPDDRSAAPAISGELLGGGTYDPATAKGKVVVVNFWGSWCAPCRVEADDLEAVHKDLPEVEFLGINVWDERDKALAFMRERSSYPSIFDRPGRLALEFKDVPPNTTPATIIIDKQGKVAAVIRKAVQKDDLRAMVDEVLKEAKA
ncbi:MAG TPA: TlpA disulfide reductase family protein [Candidatus Limnocylindrales bacterium]